MSSELNKQTAEELIKALNSFTKSMSRQSNSRYGGYYNQEYYSDRRTTKERTDVRHKDKLFSDRLSKNLSGFEKSFAKEVEKLSSAIKIDGYRSFNEQLKESSKLYDGLNREIDQLRKAAIQSTLSIRALRDADLLATTEQYNATKIDLINKLNKSNSLLSKEYIKSLSNLQELDDMIQSVGNDMYQLSSSLEDVNEATLKNKKTQNAQVKALLQAIKKIEELSLTSSTLNSTHKEYSNLLLKGQVIQEKIAKGETVRQSEIDDLQQRSSKFMRENINKHKELTDTIFKTTKSAFRFNRAMNIAQNKLEDYYGRGMLKATGAIAALSSATYKIVSTLQKVNTQLQTFGLGANELQDYPTRIFETFANATLNGLDTEGYNKVLIDNARYLARSTSEIVNGINYPINSTDDVSFSREDIFQKRLSFVTNMFSKIGIQLKDSSTALAGMNETLANAGIDIRNQNSFNDAITKQISAFSQLRVGTSLTLEQFNALQQDLQDTSDTQRELLGLSQRERLQKLLDYTLQINTFKLKGLELEQSKELLKTLISQQRARVSDRFTQAASSMSVGALLSSAGYTEANSLSQEYAALKRSGRTDNETITRMNDIARQLVQMQAEAYNSALDTNNIGMQQLLSKVDDVFADSGIKDIYNQLAKQEVVDGTKTIDVNSETMGIAAGTLSDEANLLKNVVERIDALGSNFKDLFLPIIVGFAGLVGIPILLLHQNKIHNTIKSTLAGINQYEEKIQKDTNDIKENVQRIVKSQSRLTNNSKGNYSHHNRKDNSSKFPHQNLPHSNYPNKHNNKHNTSSIGETLKDIVTGNNSNDDNVLISIDNTVKLIYKRLLKCSCGSSGDSSFDIDSDKHDKKKKKRGGFLDSTKDLLSSAGDFTSKHKGKGLLALLTGGITLAAISMDDEKTLTEKINAGVGEIISMAGQALVGTLGGIAGFFIGGPIGSAIGAYISGEIVDNLLQPLMEIDYVHYFNIVIDKISSFFSGMASGISDFIKGFFAIGSNIPSPSLSNNNIENPPSTMSSISNSGYITTDNQSINQTNSLVSNDTIKKLEKVLNDFINKISNINSFSISLDATAFINSLQSFNEYNKSFYEMLISKLSSWGSSNINDDIQQKTIKNDVLNSDITNTIIELKSSLESSNKGLNDTLTDINTKLSNIIMVFDEKRNNIVEANNQERNYKEPLVIEKEKIIEKQISNVETSNNTSKIQTINEKPEKDIDILTSIDNSLKQLLIMQDLLLQSLKTGRTPLNPFSKFNDGNYSV